MRHLLRSIETKTSTGLAIKPRDKYLIFIRRRTGGQRPPARCLESQGFTTNTLDEIENTFFEGPPDRLSALRCPDCGDRLMYSMWRGERDSTAPAGRRYRCGVSIYCNGSCINVKSRLDGFCPGWAESIEDWEAFSKNL